MLRLFLVGFMGSGKTTIGRKLSELLGLSFIDLDHFIEKKFNKSVSQLFAENGEDGFRIVEKDCLNEVAQFENCVVATGGGTPCFYDNMHLMNETGMTIFLDIAIDELTSRLEHSKSGKRPLIADKKGDELRNFISNGLQKREPYYNLAKLKVSGSDMEILNQITKLVSR